METQKAYDQWAAQYDSNLNRTRDLEARSLRETLASLEFGSCLEIGCGTGKNSSWLVQHTQHLTAVDFSEAMLAKAKEKLADRSIEFVQADITQPWTFQKRIYELVSFSLVLEHIEDLDAIFRKTVAALKSGGLVYISELHPGKQYTGSKARFDNNGAEQVVPCFTHHLTDFTKAAQQNGLSLQSINEYFDDDDRNNPPRLLTLLFRK